MNVFVPGPPRRFSNLIGLVFSFIAIILRALDQKLASWIVWAVLLFFASLAGFLNMCAGCWMFALLIRMGVVPKETCEACNFQYVDMKPKKAVTKSNVALDKI